MTNAMRTGEEYLKALDDGRRVWVGNEKVDNLATHPKTRDMARRIADFYDLHHRADLQEELTFVDDDGARRSLQWQRPYDVTLLRRRRAYYESISRLLPGGTGFGRTPEAGNAALLTYIDDPQPWEDASVGTEGRGLADNLRRFWHYCRDNDLYTGPLFIDTQPDRSRPEAAAESPALHVVETNDDGIIVDGVKAVGSGTPMSDWLHIGCFYRPGVTPEQVIFAAIPTNTAGVTLVCRESLVRDESKEHPVASLGDELDCVALFDNVFIPWSGVFHLGNPQHAQLYPQRVFDWLHHNILVRSSVKAELMAGLTLLMGDSLGTGNIPAVQTRMARLIGFHQTLKAHVFAAEEQGFKSPGGMWKPNILMVDFGRAFFLEQLHEMTHELIDLSGRAAFMIPTVGQWEQPELRRWLEPIVTGPTKKPEERLQIARVVRDLFLSDWAGRQKMFDNFNGTPLMMVRMLTMMRAEFAPDGPATTLARAVCGITSDSLSGDESAYERQASYARAQDTAPAHA